GRGARRSPRAAAVRDRAEPPGREVKETELRPVAERAGGLDPDGRSLAGRDVEALRPSTKNGSRRPPRRAGFLDSTREDAPPQQRNAAAFTKDAVASDELGRRQRTVEFEPADLILRHAAVRAALRLRPPVDLPARSDLLERLLQQRRSEAAQHPLNLGRISVWRDVERRLRDD